MHDRLVFCCTIWFIGAQIPAAALLGELWLAQPFNESSGFPLLLAIMVGPMVCTAAIWASPLSRGAKAAAWILTPAAITMILVFVFVVLIMI